MPSLGELLKSVLEGAGKGVLHRESLKRGVDPFERDARLDQAARGRAVAEAKVGREFNEQDATAQALSRLLQESGEQSSGDPVQDAALFKALQEAEKSGLSRRFTESQISANESLVKQRELMPGEKDEDRELRRELAAGNADLRKALVNMAGNRPQLVVVTGADGTQKVVDKRQHVGQEVGQRPLPAGEQRKRADAATNLGVLEEMTKIPDKFLGPKRNFEAGMRGGMVGDVFGMDEMPPEFTDAQASVGHFRDQLVHALTGAAASVPEMRRLMTHIPDLKQRPNTFRSNVKISQAALAVAEAVNAGEMSPEEASAEVRRLLSAARGGDGRPAQPPPQRDILSPGQPTGGGEQKDSLGLFR